MTQITELPLNGNPANNKVLEIQTDSLNGLSEKTTVQDIVDKVPLSLYLPLAGGTMTGSLSMGSNALTTLPAPSADQDASTKKYVDDAIAAIPPGAAGTYNEVEKDSASQSVGRAKLDFRDTGDATVTVTDDPANDRTIISIDATAGGGGGGVQKGAPFVVGDLLQVESDAGDGTIQSSGKTVDDFLEALVDDPAPVLGGDLNVKAFTVYQELPAASGVSFAVGEVGISTDSGVVKANASSAATALGHLVVAREAIGAGQVGGFLIAGQFTTASAFTGRAPLYLTTTDGAISETAPSGSGEIVRVVGAVESANVARLNASSDWLTLA